MCLLLGSLSCSTVWNTLRTPHCHGCCSFLVSSPTLAWLFWVLCFSVWRSVFQFYKLSWYNFGWDWINFINQIYKHWYLGSSHPSYAGRQNSFPHKELVYTIIYLYPVLYFSAHINGVTFVISNTKCPQDCILHMISVSRNLPMPIYRFLSYKVSFIHPLAHPWLVLSGYIYIKSCHLQTKIVFFLQNPYVLYLPFLSYDLS